MRIKRLLPVILVFLASCAPEAPDIEERAFSIGAVEPLEEDLAAFSYYTGTIRAREEVKVYPRVEGKIHERLVRKGEEVARDEVLFTIDRDVIGHRFEIARVEAPISGKISMIYVDPGDTVHVQTPLALMQNDSTVKVRVWVGGKEYPRIKVGQTAYLSVSAWPDKEFEGEVSEVSPFFDPATHTALVELELDNPEGKLKPGMFTQLRIRTALSKGAVTVPFDAVLSDEEGDFVYVVTEGRAEKKRVETGLRQGERLEIKDGLEGTETIIYQGKEFIEQGAKVRAVKE